MSSSQSPEPPDDASIPLLTERLTLPPLELDTTFPLEPQGPSTSAPTVPLALDTSLPLGLPQPPPPLRPAPAPARPAPAPASAAATVPARPAPAPASAAATVPTRPALVPAPAAATVSPRPAPIPAPAQGPATVPAAARATVPDTASSSHWTRIELELRSSILQAIADALPQHVDNIVRTRMNDAIDRLFTQLVAETRLAVAASLREIVDQAVRAELMRLRRQKP
jgi:hypothetical protein